MQKLVDKLKTRVDVITKGGGEKAIARHTSRGKIIQGFLLCTWIPCLCPKFLKSIPLDLAKYDFSII